MYYLMCLCVSMHVWVNLYLTFFFLLLSDDNHRTCCLSGKKMYNSGKIFDGRKITSIIKY